MKKLLVSILGVLLVSSVASAVVSISSISPTQRAKGWSGDIAVSGSDFAASDVASFSGTGITILSTTVNSPTSVTLSVSVSPTATAADYTLTIRDVQANTSTATFTVSNPPQITALSPSSIKQGYIGSLVISGSDFVNTSISPITGIDFLSSSVVSSTTIVATISAGTVAAGSYDLTVTNQDLGTDTFSSLTVMANNLPPTLTNLYFDGKKADLTNTDSIEIYNRPKVKAIFTGEFEAGNSTSAILIASDTSGNIKNYIVLDASTVSFNDSYEQAVISYTLPFALDTSITNITVQISDRYANNGRDDANVSVRASTPAAATPIFAYPNPYSGVGDVDLQVWLNEPDTIRFVAFNVTGQVIHKSSSIVVTKSGKYTYTWDGMTTFGTRVASQMIRWLVLSETKGTKLGSYKMLIAR